MENNKRQAIEDAGFTKDPMAGDADKFLAQLREEFRLNKIPLTRANLDATIAQWHEDRALLDRAIPAGERMRGVAL